MTRVGACLFVLLLIALPAAQASEPPRDTWTVFTTVDAEVVDNYATVQIIVDIANRGPDPEFPFVVQLPDDAYVTGLTVSRDGEVFEAVVKEREEARAIYDEQKGAEQTGALVEKQRNSQLFAYLVNTAAFDSVRAVLTYEYYLPAERGVHALALEAPVSGFGQDLGARFDVRVRHSDGVQALWGESASGPVQATSQAMSPAISYAVGPRTTDASTPFTASYTVGAAPGGSIQTHMGDVGSFVHRFSAPADADQLPLDLVLVLDTSGSMRGEKIEQLRDAGQQLIQVLGPEDRLHMVPFSTAANAPWEGFQSMDADGRRAAADAIGGLLAAGSTNIEDGLRKGLGAFPPGSDGVPVLVVLTDGQPTVGMQTATELRALAEAENDAGASVYSIAFGEDADWPLVAGLAEDGDGLAAKIESGTGAEVDLRRFLEALATPTLRDLQVHYADGIHAYDEHAEVLFTGSEVLFLGTFDDDVAKIEGTATAIAPDGPRGYLFSKEVDDGPVQVERTVAYLQIRALEQELAAGEDVLDELVELAVKHGFVTDHTSLVVTLPPSEFRPFDPSAVPDDFFFEQDASGGSGGTGGSGGMATSTSAPTTWSTSTGTATWTTTATSSGTWTATGTPLPAVGNDGQAINTGANGFIPQETATTTEEPTDDDAGAPLGLMVGLVAVGLVLLRRRL